MRSAQDVRELLNEVGGLVPKDHRTMDYACGVLEALEWILAESKIAGRAGMIEEIRRGRDRAKPIGGMAQGETNRAGNTGKSIVGRGRPLNKLTKKKPKAEVGG